MAEGDFIRTLPDGTQIVFPEGTSKEFMDNYAKQGSTATEAQKLLVAPQQDQTAGKIIPPVEGSQGPAIQYRGAWREPLIAGGQLARGAASPLALPGDVLTAANTLSAGNLERTFPQLRSFPTTQSLDRFFTETGITPQNLQPEGFWENELAGGARGVGEGTAALLGARAPGLAYTRYPWARAGSFTQNALTGAVSGLTSAATEQALASAGMNPDQNFSYAPLVPPVAGAVAGLITGGGLTHTLATPYERVVTNMGGNIRRNLPLEENAGNALRDDLINSMASTPRTQANMGINGLYGTDLEKRDFDRLTDPNATGRTIKNIALEPHLAPILVDEQPSAFSDIGASHLANARNPDDWLNLSDYTKRAIVPDDIDRRTIENTFQSGSIPGPQGFLSRLRTSHNLRDKLILGGVLGGTGTEVLDYFTRLTQNDPSLRQTLGLMGATLPAAYYAGKWLLRNRVGRQALLGGAVGMGPGSNLAPQNLMPGEKLRQPLQQ